MTAQELTNLVNAAVGKAASEHSMAYGHQAVEVETFRDRFVSYLCRCGRTFGPPPEILALAEESADRALELHVERGINDQLRGVIDEMADALVSMVDSSCGCDACAAGLSALRKAGWQVGDEKIELRGVAPRNEGESE